MVQRQAAKIQREECVYLSDLYHTHDTRCIGLMYILGTQAVMQADQQHSVNVTVTLL